MKKNAKTVSAVLGTALLAGAGGVFAGINIDDEDVPRSVSSNTDSQEESAESEGSGDGEASEKFEQMYNMISEQYVEKVNEEELMEGAFEGMVKTLGDPHSSYMDKDTAGEFSQSLESSFEGIGAEVSMVDDTVTIVSPFRDSPAEEAGLQPNDQILAVDGEDTEGESLNETVLKIRGEKGSKVTLTVQREGSSDPFDVDVERDEIPVETVYSEVTEQNGRQIGTIEITSFSESTAEEFENQLEKLEAEEIDGLIIDVRGNPGGFLDSVEDIGDLIIPGDDKPVVQIEDRAGETVRSLSSLEERKDYPIVGLIDKGSVSASEILAAALKEAGGYELVGNTTYGKGTVQQSMPFDDGSELKLSMFKWLTPDGNWINEEGVEPTIETDQPDYFYSAALSSEEELQLDDIGEQVEIAQNILKGLGHDPGRTDGYFDEQTEAAVESFQEEAEDISVSGTIDEETAGAMNQAMFELIQDPDNDRQMEKALEVVNEQIQE
ncbi:S41 family peptidase [Alteribacillus sp. HJP-4]|uniref:S41 family peptidase n=1 Tax=Alteribacillus sp. HJP-4 TaxID=2775394 RepID=UPI0035CCCD07